MKYYKSESGEVHAYEADGSQDAYIKPGLVRMTDAEVEAHLKPPKSEEQLREEWKHGRAEAVAAITVEVDGMVFQGDETSQTRMSRSLSVMTDSETIRWVLADNTPVQVTKPQLVEALRLAGAEQARLWLWVQE